MPEKSSKACAVGIRIGAPDYTPLRARRSRFACCLPNDGNGNDDRQGLVIAYVGPDRTGAEPLRTGAGPLRAEPDPADKKPMERKHDLVP